MYIGSLNISSLLIAIFRTKTQFLSNYLFNISFSSHPPTPLSLSVSLPPSLQQVIITTPKNVAALFSLGQVYYSLQNLPKSEELFQKVLKLSPHHKETLYYLGHVYYKGQRYSEAASIWRRLDRGYKDVATQLTLAERHSK